MSSMVDMGNAECVRLRVRSPTDRCIWSVVGVVMRDVKTPGDVFLSLFRSLSFFCCKRLSVSVSFSLFVILSL